MTENQIIAEMMGKCWHDEIVKDPSGRCSKCDMGLAVPIGSCIPLIKNPDYTTGKDKADLMDKCVGEEWWHRFYFDTWDGGSTSDVHFAYLWRNLPSLVAEYKGWEGEK